MREQEKSSEKELSDMEATKLQGGKFKTIIMRMLKNLRRMDDQNENLHIEIMNIKKYIKTIFKKGQK